MAIDDIDLQILSALQKDARGKLSTIARDVHLSVTAVTRRIERMEDNGVILGYGIRLDPEQVGASVHGFIVGGVYRVMLSKFYDYITTVPEIARCETIISGGKEVLLEFYCKDLDHLMAFYKSGIRQYLDSMTVYLIKGIPNKDESVPLYLQDENNDA